MRRTLPRATLRVVLGAAVLVAGVIAIVAVRSRDSSPSALVRPSGIPAEVSTSLANLMALAPVPRQRAPGFTLTDQHGRRLGLGSFRVHPVVLEFMDPHCTDICPIVSQEFVDAYHDLGQRGPQVGAQRCRLIVGGGNALDGSNAGTTVAVGTPTKRWHRELLGRDAG